MNGLRWYPRAWRLRYGAELEGLMEELDDRERSSLATRFDLARGGLAERFRILAPGPLAPRERAREGALLVVHAWMLFVIGGFGIAKLSEHWQAVTPAAKQSLPAHAFTVLYWTAGVGSVLVLAGVVLALPALFALLRRGGFAGIRRPLVRAVLLTILGVACTAGLSRWAHTLGPAKRNGGDSLYSAAFALCALLVASCLFAWSTAAAVIARRLELPRTILRLEAALAGAVGAAMLVMAAATTIWWAALANAAPWFFSGRPVGTGGSVLQPNLIAASVLIATATALGFVGAERSLRAGWRA